MKIPSCARSQGSCLTEVCYGTLCASLLKVPQDKEMDNLKPENIKIEEITITEEDIQARLAKLKVNKSPEPDNLYPRVLHEIRTEIAYPVKLVFENSLRSNKLPIDWKSA